MHMFNFIIELVRLGFHGVAVVMLFLGYRLLRGVVVGKSKVDGKIGVDKLKLRLKEVRVFLVISLVFFVLGVGSEFFRKFQERLQENVITVHIQPESAIMPEKNSMPILLKEKMDCSGCETVSMNKATKAFKVKVKHGQIFYLQLYNLTQKLESLNNLVKQLTKGQGNNREGGFDDGNI